MPKGTDSNSPKRRYEVKPGDCVSSIAAKAGFTPDAIWRDDANTKLRDARANPQVLAPGDVVQIPERRAKNANCPAERVHRFVRRGIPEKLRLFFQDEEGLPRAGVPYTLTIGTVVQEGSTDPEGKVEHPIPPDATTGTLELDDERYELQLGHLPPITTPGGLLERLWALGYVTEGLIDSGLVHIAPTLRDFQEAQGLPVTGTLDAATRDALRKAYGC